MLSLKSIGTASIILTESKDEDRICVTVGHCADIKMEDSLKALNDEEIKGVYFIVPYLNLMSDLNYLL